MPLGVGVAVVLAICWAYLIGMAWGMEMMMAMMLPSAVPLLFLLFRTHLASSGRHRALLLCGTVALGYLTATACAPAGRSNQRSLPGRTGEVNGATARPKYRSSI